MCSWCLELWRYRGSRFPARLFLPLALVLVLASFAAGEAVTAREFAGRMLLACTLLFQFRLWDDLCDRARDRQDHPERVLVQTSAVAPFRVLLALTFALNFVLLAFRDPRLPLGVFLTLNAVFLTWYAWLRRLCHGVFLSYHVILLKYPVFVYLLSGRLSVPLVYALAGVYFCLCVFEVLHDARLRQTPRAVGFLAVELAALVVAALLLLTSFRSPLGGAS